MQSMLTSVVANTQPNTPAPAKRQRECGAVAHAGLPTSAKEARVVALVPA
jgi:hypothetical protein